MKEAIYEALTDAQQAEALRGLRGDFRQVDGITAAHRAAKAQEGRDYGAVRKGGYQHRQKHRQPPKVGTRTGKHD